MDAKDLTLGNLLSPAQSRRFIIPTYQREYDWGKDNLNEFWEDLILASKKNEKLFLGMFVLREIGQTDQEKADRKPIQYDVVDGQQRITTVTLFSYAIFNHLHKKIQEVDDDDLIEEIQDHSTELKQILFHKDKKDKKRYSNLHASPKIKSIIDHLMSNPYEKLPEFPDRPSELKKMNHNAYNKIRDGINWFSKKVETKELHDICNIVTTLLSSDVIETIVDSDDEAYMLFEVLNDRGKDLEIGDLLKNHLFSQTKNDEAFQKQWDKIKENVPKNFKTPLKQFAYLHHGAISGKDIYKKLKLIHPKKPSKFLDDLEAYSRWCKIFNGTNKDYKEYMDDLEIPHTSQSIFIKEFKSIEALKLLDFQLVLPVIYAVLLKTSEIIKKTKNPKDLKGSTQIFLRSLENYVFYNYFIGGKSVGNFERICANYAKEIMICKAEISALIDLQKKFFDELANDRITAEEFKLGFEKINYTNTPSQKIRYIFFRIDMARNKEKQSGSYVALWGYDSASAQNNVEHWAPKKKPTTNLSSYADGKNYFDNVYGSLSDEDLHSIGNLLVLSEDENNHVNQNSPENKMKILMAQPNRSRFVEEFITKYSDSFEIWDIEKIRERRRALSEEAHEVFGNQLNVLNISNL